MRGTSRGWMEDLYDRLAEDDEGRVCKGISEKACRETPGNFFKILVSNTLTSIGDKVASAKTTLPWLLGAVGGPAWIVSLLVPIRESGSMLPQMLIGAWVRKHPVRKSLWSLGSALQGVALLLMAWSALALEGSAAGWAILGCLIGFSIARGLCSVAYKDVLGKTIPKTRRGRLSGWIAAVSGLGAMGVGASLGLLSDDTSPRILAAVLGGAGVLWFAAAFAFQRVVEFPGEVEGGADGLKKAFQRWTLLRDDLPFRRFVIGRALAMGSGLAAPFYVTIARGDLGQAARFLGIFLLMEGLAGLISAPIWGRWADRSSRMVFVIACGLASTMTLLVAAISLSEWSGAIAIWFYPLAFFILGLAHAGVRLGRKTYLVDMADGNKRTDYVAVSNTAMGLLLLVAGALGAMLAGIAPALALILFAMAGLLAAYLGYRWDEVSAAPS